MKSFLKDFIFAVILTILVCLCSILFPKVYKIAINELAKSNTYEIYSFEEYVYINPLKAMIDPNYKGEKAVGRASGTAFLARYIDTTELLNMKDIQVFVSNDHVCRDNKEMLMMYENQEVKLQVLVKDEEKDLCLLKLPTQMKKSIFSFFITDASVQLQTVYTAGYPYGKNFRVYEGEITGEFKGVLKESTLKVGPGQSGSPVFNALGIVVGIINSVDTRTGEGFFIDSYYLISLIKRNQSLLE